MGLCVPKDFARGSGLHECLEDEPMQRVFSPRRELSIGERPGAAEPELDIAFRIELSGGVEARDGFAAPHRIGAPLDQQRLQAGFGECQGGKEAGASCTDDDRTAMLHGV